MALIDPVVSNVFMGYSASFVAKNELTPVNYFSDIAISFVVTLVIGKASFSSQP